MDIVFAADLAFKLLIACVVACPVLYFLGRKNWIKATATALISLSLFLLRYPTQISPIGALEKHIVTTFEVLKYFSMGKAFAPLGAAFADIDLSHFYFTEVLLMVAAPICSAVWILTFFKWLGRARKWLFWRPVYYFSQLNEKSLALAQNIHQQHNGKLQQLCRPILIFCNAAKADAQFRNKARELDAVFYDKTVDAVSKPDPWQREVKVFLIDMDDNANMSGLLNLQDWIIGPNKTDPNTRHTDSELLVFSTDPSSELLFDKLLAEIKAGRLQALAAKATSLRTTPEELYRNEESRLNLHLIHETNLITQKLLQEHPLYDVLDQQQDASISVLVVGCGYLGTQFMKNAMLCGTMVSCDFRIQVIDRDGKALEKQFFHDHPFLNRASHVLKTEPGQTRPAVAPIFHAAPVCTPEFDDILKTHCAASNYIVVSTGDDRLNITTARYLQRWYAKEALVTKKPIPLIFVAVRDPKQYKMLKTLEQDRFFLFANNMDLYRMDQLVDRPLDAVAAMLHAAYLSDRHYAKGQLLRWDDEIRQESKRRLLQTNLMQQRSNQAAALHSLYKLHDLSRLTGQYNCDFRTYARLLGEWNQEMEQLEHRRWVLFHALNGWDLYEHEHIWAQLKDMPKPVAPEVRVHRNNDAQLHGCMIPSEELPAFARKLQEHTQGALRDFTGNDQAICWQSLFAWLILQEKPETAKTIRQELLDALDPEAEQITLQELQQVLLQKAPLQ